MMGVAATTIGVIAPAALLWAAPVLFTALLLAGYPLRRALFEETWSAGTYLSFFHRLTFGIFGFWILLAALPFLASLAGPLDWLAGAVLAAVLIVWERHYAGVLRACLRAAPLDDGPLRDRCGALAQAFGMPQPEYLRVALRGGTVANALALPSLRGNGVVFSDTLLTRLSLDEVASICAHELAHFEVLQSRPPAAAPRRLADVDPDGCTDYPAGPARRDVRVGTAVHRVVRCAGGGAGGASEGQAAAGDGVRSAGRRGHRRR